MTIASATLWADRPDTSAVAGIALKLAARFSFAVTVIGQWIFVVYVVGFYGGSALRGDLDRILGIHLVFAVIIFVGGPLQLIPELRRYAPAFHHWNGRVYLLAVFVISIGGLHMIWSRGPAGFVVRVGTGLHALLIMSSAVLAVRYAVARDISSHSRWALRLFMVINAGWFFRIGLLRWAFLNHGPDGQFLSFFSLADYLLPLVILEMYLLMRDRAGVSGRLAMAAGLLMATVVMAIGLFAATKGMWLPRM